MTKDQFDKLWLEALERAARNADAALGQSVPRKFRIEFHGLGYSGVLLTAEDVGEMIYLESDRFFKVIDVAVIEVGAEQTTIFVRVSGHSPCGFSETWDPGDLGPFKQLLSAKIRIAGDG